MTVHQVVNPHRSSNTYIVELEEDGVLLVDPGNFDPDYLSDWLFSHGKKLHWVILTHEHSDHCMGLGALSERYSFELYCSGICGMNIGNSRQNFSFYIEEIDTFEISMPFIAIKDGDAFDIGGETFIFMETPGHSPGGICISAESVIFTGDTILNGIKTPLSFPHSNKKDYAESILKLKQALHPGMKIFPGHDAPFGFTSFEDLVV